MRCQRRGRVYFIITSSALSFARSCRDDGIHLTVPQNVLQFSRILLRNRPGRPSRTKLRIEPAVSHPVVSLQSRTKRTIANGGKLHAARRPIGHYSGLEGNSTRSDPSTAASSSYIVRTEPFPAHSRGRCARPCPTITC